MIRPLPLEVVTARRDWTGYAVSALVAFLASLAVSVAVILVVQQANTDARDRQRRDILRSQQVGCARAQETGAYLRQDARRNAAHPVERAALADRTFQVLDCQRTYSGPRPGVSVVLPAALQECFVTLTGRGYWVAHQPTTNGKALRQLCHLP